MWNVAEHDEFGDVPEEYVVYGNVLYRQDLIAEFLNRVGAYVDTDGRLSCE